ncbi:uncharacterized protein ATNIH1004_002019 [Aspergillus tanneri]|uniref:Non-haem dioxygenase N-terminal domain-containing protein n=1 Tax=Aspergillus tanneri TaxID=1220188 RepID=A0A5M9M3T0_9EURO|nr:uncharacterized protein ATNIH1004_002019 [Aspergillus tanneri]KAA8641351.1 hypothetical protein ATNIH1004_002019 [Aspergillus tanneri]
MTLSDTFTAIPVLDYSLATSSDTKATFLRELRNALVNVGFFYLTNPPVYGVNTSWGILGWEQSSQLVKSDYREQFDFATELPPPRPDEPLYRNIRGPNQWPDETAIPGFRHALESYPS